MSGKAGRFLNFDLAHLRSSRQGVWFLIDLIMLVLLVVNLLMILTDTLYRLPVTAEFVSETLPGLKVPLDGLKTHFFALDLGFVVVFLSEFLVRWGVAVKNRVYRRWFFYPFIHFYDLLGCIPLGSFRMLRFLRVFSILYRLHKLKVIDMRQTAPVRFLLFYYDVFMEELSDRVVVNVIKGVQEDLASGSSLGRKVIDTLLAPRLGQLESTARSVSLRLSLAMQHEADHPLGKALRTSVIASMQGNEDLRKLAEAMPMVGGVLHRRLEDLVAEIVVDTVATLIEQSPAFLRPEVIGATVDWGDDAMQRLDQEVLSLIQDILALIKEQMQDKAWQRRLDEKDAARSSSL
ncbi:MAG: hypothetical protein IPM37_01090 [Hahellaceae bacterium]|nr:hypothetical protein [Hahellaceae bacterium]